MALELVERATPVDGALFEDLGPLMRGFDPWPALMQLVGAREEPRAARATPSCASSRTTMR